MRRRNWAIFGVGTLLLAVAVVWFAVAITGEGDGPDDWRGWTMAIMALAGLWIAYRGVSGLSGRPRRPDDRSP